MEDQSFSHLPPPRYRLDDLFAAKSAEEWRAEYTGSHDPGDDVGREVLNE